MSVLSSQPVESQWAIGTPEPWDDANGSAPASGDPVIAMVLGQLHSLRAQNAQMNQLMQHVLLAQERQQKQIDAIWQWQRHAVREIETQHDVLSGVLQEDGMTRKEALLQLLESPPTLDNDTPCETPRLEDLAGLRLEPVSILGPSLEEEPDVTEERANCQIQFRTCLKEHELARAVLQMQTERQMEDAREDEEDNRRASSQQPQNAVVARADAGAPEQAGSFIECEQGQAKEVGHTEDNTLMRAPGEDTDGFSALMEAIKESGHTGPVKLTMDVAASEFFFTKKKTCEAWADTESLGLGLQQDGTLPAGGTPGSLQSQEEQRGLAEATQVAVQVAAFSDSPNPLHEAARKELSAVCLELLRAPGGPKGGVNAIDDSGETALSAAAWKGLTDVCLAILARSDFKEVNAKDDEGDTALHAAAWMNLDRVCRAIIEREDFTEVSARDIDNKTAASLAEERGHYDLHEYLKAHSA